MPPEPGDLSGRSLLAVFAHPDDESLACGGLIAWCAQLGVQVSLLCATRGEQGPSKEAQDGAPLGDIRARELEEAARILGVAEVVLLDYPDGMLPWVDAASLEADIRQAIGRLRPDVVITFGEDGLYWHPDHIAIHQRTTAAVAALGDDGPALYYVTMPPGSMGAIVDHAVQAAARNGSASAPPRLGFGIDADAFGAEAAPPTLVVDAGAFAAQKLAAITCHRTQLADEALSRVEASDAARLLGREHFHRAEVGRCGDTFMEQFAVQPVRSNQA